MHQLIPESVELLWLVTAVTGERLLPPKDDFPSAVAEMSTVHPALEMEIVAPRVDGCRTEYIVALDNSGSQNRFVKL